MGDEINGFKVEFLYVTEREGNGGSDWEVEVDAKGEDVMVRKTDFFVGNTASQKIA